FDIPAYQDKDSFAGGKLTVADADRGAGAKFDGFGVVKNVGVLKSLSITVYGSNYPNGLGVIVADQDGNEQTIFMDYLQFDGWRTLTWNNPNYVTDVRNRELRVFPLYPKGMPYLKLVGLVIYRDAQQAGGDLVTYFKDIKITYDKAILTTDRDINDEAIWGILQQRQEARRLAELKRLGNVQVLRFLEQQKMDQTQAPAAQ
ncbi:MAG TPA: flagellar filament outer layer protein FlaA, partial [Spirochaetia bacterium]|nr:flagellar filament outer layer protein FlaA [Spirochaetia bacterium]